MKKYILLLICVVLFACKSEKEENTSNSEVISVDWNKLDVLSADNIEDLFFVPLETSDESLLGNGIEICVFDSLIYLRSDAMDRLIIYDMDGKIQKTIDRKGEGPEEYIGLRNFTVNENGIFIYDAAKRSIVQYTKDGVFKKSLRFSTYPGDYAFPYKDKYVGYTSKPSEGKRAFSIYNTDGEFINDYFDNKGYTLDTSIHQTVPLSCDSSGCFISFLFDNSVYYYNGDTIVEKYKFDFGDYNMTDSRKEYYLTHFWDGFDKRNPDNCIYGIDNIVKNGDWVYLFFNRMFSSRLFLNSKNGKMLTTANTDLFFANMGSRLFINGDYFVSTVSASDVVFFQERDPNKDPNPYVKQLREINITEEDNPVLCFFKLKK